MAELEVDFSGAQKLAKSGSQIVVLEENIGDVEFVKEAFPGAKSVKETDFGEARILVMHLGEQKDLQDLAKKYENCVIICPHGNTSLRMASALKEMGVHAYSLKAGLAGLRSR